jgi:hypothetical protein
LVCSVGWEVDMTNCNEQHASNVMLYGVLVEGN